MSQEGFLKLLLELGGRELEFGGFLSRSGMKQFMASKKSEIYY